MTKGVLISRSVMKMRKKMHHDFNEYIQQTINDEKKLTLSDINNELTMSFTEEKTRMNLFK